MKGEKPETRFGRIYFSVTDIMKEVVVWCGV